MIITFPLQRFISSPELKNSFARKNYAYLTTLTSSIDNFIIQTLATIFWSWRVQEPRVPCGSHGYELLQLCENFYQPSCTEMSIIMVDRSFELPRRFCFLKKNCTVSCLFILFTGDDGRIFTRSKVRVLPHMAKATKSGITKYRGKNW